MGTVAAKSVAWGGAAPDLTLATGQAPSAIKLTFTPATALADDGKITITADKEIFKAAAADSKAATELNNGADKLKAAAVDANKKKTIITANGAMLPGTAAVVTLKGANMAVNPAAGAVKFAIETSTDTTGLTAQTGYTTVAAASVTWGSADVVTSKESGKAPGNLKVTFTKLASVIAANDFITLTASKAIFAAGCTATTLANVKCGTWAMAVDAANTKTTSTSELVIKVTGSCAYGTKAVSFEVTSNMAVNPAAGAITFSASTTKDSTAVTGQTGYTITAASTPPTPTPTPATKASAYTSGGAKAPAPAPASAATAKHFIEAEVKLDGITVAQFDAAAKTAFKQVIASSLEGVSAADVYDVKATAARRAGVKVSFKVKVKDAATAESGATTLTTFLKDTTGDKGFLKQLKAKGGNLAKVSGVTVTKAPAAKASATVSGVAKTAAMSITSMVAVACALLR